LAERLLDTQRFGAYGDDELFRATCDGTQGSRPVKEPIDWAVRVLPWEPSGEETEIGHDPGSRYFEIFWVPVTGPFAGHLYRRMARGLKTNPNGFVLDTGDLEDFPTGQETDHARLVTKLDNAIGRCASLGLLRETPNRANRELYVRCMVPTLPEQHLARLPRPLRMAHRRLEDGESNPNGLEALRTRARRLAASLLLAGEDPSSIADHLAGWHLHPALIWETQRWAYLVADKFCTKGEPDEEGLSSSTKSLTPNPVPPLCQSPSSTLDLAGPAMSR